jgi:hypothetical protein
MKERMIEKILLLTAMVIIIISIYSCSSKDSKMHKYENVGVLENAPPGNVFVAIKYPNNKWGFKNEKGEVLMSGKYDSVIFQTIAGISSNSTKDSIITTEDVFVKLNEKWGLVNNFGREIIKPIYDSIAEKLNKPLSITVVSTPNASASFHNYYYIEMNNKWGIVDSQGIEIILPQYENIGGFTEENMAVFMNNGKIGLINTKGIEMIQPIYDSLIEFQNGYVVNFKGKYGFIDIKGNVITPCIYQQIKPEGHLYVRVKKDNKYGWLDIETKDIAIPIKYDFVWGELKDTNSIAKVRIAGEIKEMDYYGRIKNLKQ